MRPWVEFLLLSLLMGVLARVGFDFAPWIWRRRRASGKTTAGKVRIVSDGRYHGTRVYDVLGQPLHGVRGLFVDVDARGGVSAHLEWQAIEMDVQAEPHVSVIDPRSGQRKYVRRIEWTDGTSFELAAEVGKA